MSVLPAVCSVTAVVRTMNERNHAGETHSEVGVLGVIGAIAGVLFRRVRRCGWL